MNMMGCSAWSGASSGMHPSASIPAEESQLSRAAVVFGLPASLAVDSVCARDALAVEAPAFAIAPFNWRVAMFGVEEPQEELMLIFEM